MEDQVAIIAVIAGAVSVLATALGAIGTLIQIKFNHLRRPGHRTLELRIEGNKYLIDVSRIDSEDPKKIEDAIKAVKAAKTTEMAAVA